MSQIQLERQSAPLPELSSCSASTLKTGIVSGKDTLGGAALETRSCTADGCEPKQPHVAAEEVEYRKSISGRTVARYLVSAKNAGEIDAVLTEKGWAHDAHGNAKPVMVWGNIDEEKYSTRVREHGAKPIVDHYFPSAKAASYHFGYNWDAVGQALGRAKRRHKDSVKVGGVPVKWANDICGIE
jgi:hypothetical protein